MLNFHNKHYLILVKEEPWYSCENRRFTINRGLNPCWRLRHTVRNVYEGEIGTEEIKVAKWGTPKHFFEKTLLLGTSLGFHILKLYEQLFT